MQKFKSECEILVKRNAVVLLRDGFTESGTPVYVTRKVIGLYGKKYGRGSEWGICIDKPLYDGTKKVFFKSIKGWNINGDIVTLGLLSDMDRFARSLKPAHVDMIVSDARVRLKMDGEDNERYNGRAKPEELNRRVIENLHRYRNNIPLAGYPDKKPIQTHQAVNSNMQHDPQSFLKELVCSLKNVLSDIKLRYPDDYERLFAQNTPPAEKIQFPISSDFPSGLKSVSDACAEIQAFSMSPEILTLVHSRL